MHFKTKLHKILLSALLLALLATGALAQTTSKSAEEVLQQAVTAIGGLEKLRGLKSLYTESVNLRQEIGQSFLPTLNEDWARVPRESFITETWVDFAGGRRYWHRKLNNTHYVNITTPTWGANLTGDRHNHLGATVVDLYQHRNRHMTFPGPLLTALEKKSELRLLAEQRYDGRMHSVLAFNDLGREVRLFVDQASGLVSKTEMDENAPVRGKVALEYRYSKWTEIGGLRLPLRTEGFNTQGGTSNWAIEDQIVEVNKPEGDRFKGHEAMMKDGLERVARDRAAASAPPPPITADKLAEGIYHLRGFANSLVVEMGEQLLLIEAPLSEARSRQVMAKIKELFPNKPIAVAGMTHWHYDHAAGLRAYAAEGIRIAASSANKEFLEKFLSPNSHDDALSKSGRKPSFLWINNKFTLSQGGRTLEVYEVPNTHSAGMLVAYFPDAGVLFVSDLYPSSNPEDARAVWELLQKHKLEVKLIATGHGAAVPISQLQKLAAR
jgi:glyoxylase-like metal-dependent hydrolase (beta-lactamase superfamily II)